MKTRENEYVVRRMGRAACAAGLSSVLVLSGLVQAPPPAYAVDASVTITSVNNKDPQYLVYQLFTASIDDENQPSGVAFGSALQGKSDAFVAFLNSANAAGANAYDTWLKSKNLATDTDIATQRIKPENVLAYLSDAFGSITDAENNTPKWPASGSLPDKVAAWVQTNAASNTTTTAASTTTATYTGAEGYYLFLTDTSSKFSNGDATTDAESATLPIFAPVGGSVTAITEKASPAGLDKEIKENSTGTYGTFADAEIGELVDYRITVTLPNLANYSEFYAELTDTLSAGLELDTSTVKVFADSETGPDITSKFSVSYANQTLTVKNANILASSAGDIATAGAPVSELAGSGKKIVVTYRAKLTGASVVYGGAGNPNTAYFTYSNNPDTNTHGRTKDDKVSLLVYTTTINKVDATTTTTKLDGAGFKISNAAGKYLNANGEWVDGKANGKEFITASGGVIADIKGLDAGVYTLEETTAPEGYNLPLNPKFKLTITRTFGTDFTNPLNGTLTATIDNADLGSTTVSAAADSNLTDATGNITATIKNSKQSLAQTGAAGVGIAGVLVVGGGLLWREVRRRKSEDNKSED